MLNLDSAHFQYYKFVWKKKKKIESLKRSINGNMFIGTFPLTLYKEFTHKFHSIYFRKTVYVKRQDNILLVNCFYV